MRNACARSGLRYRQFSLRVNGIDETPGRRGFGGAARPRRAGGLAWPRWAYCRPASVPRPGNQSARGRHRRARAVDRLPAMALPYQRRHSRTANFTQVQEHRSKGCSLDLERLPRAAGGGRERGLPQSPQADMAHGRIHRGKSRARWEETFGANSVMPEPKHSGLHTKHINESADVVMYWWDRAAEILAAKGTSLRRFGLVTTKSITQEYCRRVVAKRMDSKHPISLLMAIPNHPWTKATPDAAQVRIAMTVASSGAHEGVLNEVVHEAALDTDEPKIEFASRVGKINSDLTIGVDVTKTKRLLAN